MGILERWDLKRRKSSFKMNAKILIAVFLPALVVGDKVCIPNKMTYQSWLPFTNQVIDSAIDHTLKMGAFSNADFRMVRDYAHMMDYTMLPNGTYCSSSPTDPKDGFFPECMDNAVYVGNGTFGLGVEKLTGMSFTFQLPGNGSAVMVVSRSGVDGMYIPLMYRTDVHPEYATVMFNVMDGIKDPAVFQVPDLCPPKSIV